MISRREFLYGAAAGVALAQERPDAGLPDFSSCGSNAECGTTGQFVIKPESGDATERIQSALDKLSGNCAGLLLTKGEYEIGGTLRIRKSGVVISGEEGTTLIGTGTKPRALIEIRGANPGVPTGAPVRILDELVPVGAKAFRIANPRAFRKGQLVIIRRIGNAAWIHEIGMDRIQGRPGSENTTKQWEPFNLDFERRIAAIDDDHITIDAPVFCAIEQRWGGGEIIAFDDSGRISGCGIENLRGISSFDKSVTALYGREKEKYFSDEAHAKDFVAIEAANHCWVRGLKALHFSFACVNIGRTRNVTVEDCDCREMVSEITGSRRYCYSVNGQRTLVRRCTGDSGRHDFAVGARVAGPNVFLDCKAGRSFATSEPHHRWSVGGLYDNVKANIAFQDRQWMGTGHGWSGANYVAWNCEGSLVCQKPPTANNWAIGQLGPKEKGAFAPREDGTWISRGKHVVPRSLYESQLKAARGR